MLVLDLDYTVGTDTVVFRPETNIKPEARAEVLSNFIHTQIGAGQDLREAVPLYTYHIRVELDLSSDSYTWSHDCGNSSLALGVLMAVLQKLS